MELNVLEKKKYRLVFELKGADHTICNALKNELWNDDDVKVATYAVHHPLIAVPKFIIETKNKDAADAVTEAIGRLQKQFKSFATVFGKI